MYRVDVGFIELIGFIGPYIGFIGLCAQNPSSSRGGRQNHMLTLLVRDVLIGLLVHPKPASSALPSKRILAMPLQVLKQRFWMQGWGGPTPKATCVWSSSRIIRKFSTSKRALYKGRKVGPLADCYIDKSGKRRWKGNQLLKGSQPGPYNILTTIANSMKP